MASPMATRKIMRRRRTPGSRANRACTHCKAKRLKCDEQIPSCAHCLRSHLTCLVEDPDTKKLRPRNYLEILETRLASLEQRDTQQKSNNGISSPSSLPTSTDSSQSHSVLLSGTEDSSACALPIRVGLLDFRTTQVEPHYLGSSSSFAFAHLINPSLRGVLNNKSFAPLQTSEKAESAPLPCLLPEYHIAIMLSNAYFENIHPQYPFLHEPTFRHYEVLLLNSSTEFNDPIQASIPLFFLNMVYAIGARIVPGYENLSEQLYSSAQLYPEVLSVDNVEAIQAILCYAIYSLRSPKGPSLWKLSGFALRQCIELGYHRSMKCDHSKRDALHIELSKRVFWVAQGLDVTFALRLGRPLGIQLNDIDAELPLDIDDSSISVSGIENTTRLSVDGVPTSMSNAIHVIRLRIIWAKIHSLVYSGTVLKDTDNENHRASIIQLREDLEQWRSRMPELRPRRGKTLSIFLTKAWYELNYYGSILLLYRPQLAEDKNTPDKIFIDCMEAASYICREYRRQYIGTDVKPTWSSLHFLFLAGLTYLHCLWSSSVASRSVRQSEVNKTCNDCTMVLVVIAEMWKGAAPYRDIFETLASHTVSMIINRSLSFNLPEGPALADPLDREAVTGWISDIDDMGMLDVFDDMLAGFVNDIGPYDDIAQFET